ncbi:MAG: energy-coupling factor transporter transmembrane protein EcfT [Clostridia bacterium]|nr:energy-coupling factor transporter transmembrane protein EcfT [Clostridia bacterium]
MLKNMTLGQYFPGDSFIHRLDPRTKLLATIALIAIVFVSQGFSGFLAIAAFVLIAAASTGIHLKFLFRGLKPIMFIVIFTFVLNLFFQTGGTELVRLGFLRVTDQGLRMAGFMAVRLILLVVCSQLLTLTTSPIALTDGLESLFRPLEAIHFPAHEIAMMMSIALRFIPTLMDEADKIMKAQKARGANFETGSVLARAKAMVPLLVPLFVGAFRRAEELALAMDARCYRGGKGRTRMKQLKYGTIDLLAGLALLLLLAAVIALNALGAF